MATEKIVIVKSDITGQQIPEGEVWEMLLSPPDGRKNKVRLDVAENEIQQFLSAGAEVKRRGRRPGSKNKPKES